MGRNTGELMAAYECDNDNHLPGCQCPGVWTASGTGRCNRCSTDRELNSHFICQSCFNNAKHWDAAKHPPEVFRLGRDIYEHQGDNYVLLRQANDFEMQEITDLAENRPDLQSPPTDWYRKWVLECRLTEELSREIRMLKGKAIGTYGGVPVVPEGRNLTLKEKVERTIDWMEEMGIPLLPWQATAFRAIMLNGEITLYPSRKYYQAMIPKREDQRGMAVQVDAHGISRWVPEPLEDPVNYTGLDRSFDQHHSDTC